MSDKIITISRQFGSGGYLVGKKLSEELDIPFYDKDIIALAAEKCGMSPKMLEELDETMPGLIKQAFAVRGNLMPYTEDTLNDRIYFAESAVIKAVAESGSCVIVGRCADYILRDMPNLYNVYVYADLEFRTKIVSERLDISEKGARALIVKTDKRRASYYNFYTDKAWGKAENYHLCVDSGFSGIDKTVAIIKQYVSL